MQRELFRRISLLEAISRAAGPDGRAKPGDAAALVGEHPPLASRLAKALREAGLIEEYREKPRSGRGTWWSLTPAARALLRP